MNEDQFLSIYHEHLASVFTFVARRVGDERALVEDVVQETWLRAVRAWTAEGAPASPSAWLRTVARNLIRNHFRAARAVSPREAGRPRGGSARRPARGPGRRRPGSA